MHGNHPQTTSVQHITHTHQNPSPLINTDHWSPTTDPRQGGLDDLVVPAEGPHPIPSRTRP